MDQRDVIVNDRRVRTDLQSPLEIGDGRPIVLPLVVENAAVQGRFAEIWIESQRTVIIEQRLVYVLESGVGQGTVVKAVGARRTQGEARAKRADSICVPLEAVSTLPPIEAGPKILRIEKE